ncbi:hypothetical protein CLOSYM_03766 [[Clostridium] symbiosum ATCC 14940]|uniref:Uncharacterized protein n=1 Tax=[Clostridium] symbiosum ATCC 14940 TaxID=411472 RepID=A0ABC9TTT8_CLOSY|nr:hypothetical protein CLOSYM_03766 [[Clostridium] symbiosum ATCC 14940]
MLLVPTASSLFLFPLLRYVTYLIRRRNSLISRIWEIYVMNM